MAIAESLRAFLESKGCEYELVPHPKSGSTHESARGAHVPDDHIAKAVVLIDAKSHAMAVIPGSLWLKLDAVNAELDRSFELASERQVDELFQDCAPGAVPPVGLAYGLETFLDEALTTLANVFFEAGDHEHLVHVSGEAFLDLMRGVRRGRFCHDQ
jgi:Ala-tRNA(Pro) deacylase